MASFVWTGVYRAMLDDVTADEKCAVEALEVYCVKYVNYEVLLE